MDLVPTLLKCCHDILFIVISAPLSRRYIPLPRGLDDASVTRHRSLEEATKRKEPRGKHLGIAEHRNGALSDGRITNKQYTISNDINGRRRREEWRTKILGHTVHILYTYDAFPRHNDNNNNNNTKSVYIL